MSSNLIWEPIIDRGKYLSDELKFILRMHYGETINTSFSHNDVPYLEGVRDASPEKVKKELQVLLDAIEKYDSVRIWEEF